MTTTWHIGNGIENHQQLYTGWALERESIVHRLSKHEREGGPAKNDRF
jgi:hypothetical protein